MSTINPAWLHCRQMTWAPAWTSYEEDNHLWREERRIAAQRLKSLSKAERRKEWYPHLLKRRMEAI